MTDKLWFLRNKWSSVAILVFLLTTWVVSTGTVAARQDPQARQTVEIENAAFDVFRPSANRWIKVKVSELQPLDILIQGGKVYHIDHGISSDSKNVSAVLLGRGTKRSLKRHESEHDPNAVSYPGDLREIVYARWQGTGPWTFQHLGAVENNQVLVFEGREFKARFNTDGSLLVKPTGNVLSKVTDVWSDKHENQLHLTLHFPDTGDISKLTTTHDHPFYVPSTRTWVPAADLKVGTDLQTCKGSPALVRDLKVVHEAFTAYNISVEHTHNFYVADAAKPATTNNLGAPAVLVHNDCSRIKESPLLVREARRSGRNAKVQEDIDSLTNQLSAGNHNPGLGSKPIGSGISEARGRNGGRVYYRIVGEQVEILGKSGKHNQQRVMDEVLRVFGR